MRNLVISKHVPNSPIDGIKPCCKCGSRQACLYIQEGKLFGLCVGKNKTSCWFKNWSKDLSICANYRCDELNISFEERITINPGNILKNLGFP